MEIKEMEIKEMALTGPMYIYLPCRLLADLQELGSVPCVYYFVDSAAGAGQQLDTASLALPLVLVTGDNPQPAAWTQVHTRPVPRHLSADRASNEPSRRFHNHGECPY